MGARAHTQITRKCNLIKKEEIYFNFGITAITDAPKKKKLYFNFGITAITDEPKKIKIAC